MKIESKLLLADEITMWDAAQLMAGERPFSDDDSDSDAEAFEADYREMYSPSSERGQTREEIWLEDVNVQVALLEGALNRRKLTASKNPDGTKFELTLNKQEWLSWLATVGRYGYVLDAFSGGIPAPTSSNKSHKELDANKHWTDAAREIADELHKKDLRAGAWSSNKDMSERIALIAVERKIRGPHGQLTAGNILREALQGGRWIRPTSQSEEDL